MFFSQNELQEYHIHKMLVRHKIKRFTFDSLPQEIKDLMRGTILQAWVRDGFLDDLHYDGLFEYSKISFNRYKGFRSRKRIENLETIAFWVLVACGLISAYGVLFNGKSAPTSSQSQQSAPIQQPKPVSPFQNKPIQHTTVPLQDSSKKSAN
jgi:hypothetical protein